MTFYHGSPIGGLSELKPSLSEHNKPYIYFATNPLVALLYAVKPVPKPFSFYPYGFDKNGVVIYSEYFEDAFSHLYKGKIGYLYECDDLKNANNPTNICCAYTCTEPIKVKNITKIPDLYAYFKQQEENGLFKIKPKKDISDKEIAFVFCELKKDVENNHLKNRPQHPMSVFIQEYFPSVWNTAEI